MNPQDPRIREWTRDLSLLVIRELAPDEEPLAEEWIEEVLDDPRAALSPGDEATDDALAFGVGGMLSAVTPVVVTVASGVLAFIGNELLKGLREESGKLLRERVRALFRRGPEPPPGAPGGTALSKDQLQQVRDHAIEQAKACGMSEADAARLASSLVGSLALA